MTWELKDSWQDNNSMLVHPDTGVGISLVKLSNGAHLAAAGHGAKISKTTLGEWIQVLTGIHDSLDSTDELFEDGRRFYTDRDGSSHYFWFEVELGLVTFARNWKEADAQAYPEDPEEGSASTNTLSDAHSKFWLTEVKKRSDIDV